MELLLPEREQNTFYQGEFTDLAVTIKIGIILMLIYKVEVMITLNEQLGSNSISNYSLDTKLS